MEKENLDQNIQDSEVKEFKPKKQLKTSLWTIREYFNDLKLKDERMDYLVHNFPLYKITGLLNDLKTEKARILKIIEFELIDSIDNIEAL